MYSLNRRLTLSLTASLVFFFIIQSLIINSAVEELSEQNIISRLKHDQKDLLLALSWNDSGQAQFNTSRIADIYMHAFSGHYYEVTVNNHTFHSKSLWDEQLITTSTPLTRNAPGPQEQVLFILSQDFMMQNKVVKIRIAEDISHLDAMTEAFQERLLLLAAIAIFILLILQSWIIRYGLKPLQQIRKQIGQLEKGEITQITSNSPSEIMPLVSEINRLITVMKSRLERSRHALGDLAHALKTPLSVIQQIVDRQSTTNDQKQLNTQLTQIEKRIKRELSRARTAGLSPGGYWADPYHDMHELSRIFKKLFPEKNISLKLKKDLHIKADREDMMEIFGNLLENACKWAASEVRCCITEKNNTINITIEDDGVGIEIHDAKNVLNRGTRADESKPGHGLGLAIVNEIIHAYEGEIRLQRSATLRGLQVYITLPQQ